ncbi:MAG: hypothetical protein K8R85_11740 [Bacteroidetes bacterium]|nr:hypothetical protein [Bacteroidota bacterium]
MIFFKFLFAVLVLSGIFSCKKTKYETTTVKALVFDENTQQYISNVKILLYEVQQATSLFGGHPTIKGGVIKEANTDANGQADFGEFEAKKSSDYYYVVSEDHGINYTVPANVKKGESNTIPFTVHAYAYITIKFIQPPPYNTGDSLSVSFTNYKFPWNPFKITNSNYSQFSIVNLYVGHEYINIDKYKSGIYTNIKDTVFYSASSIYEYHVYW